ncbi:kinase-like domain-containing protein [Rhizophagus irregularis DAOM 181602=DAOM 197198]|nr:kinase-like domain-containing protein [Rhizophagus irregularis DAOM 181602=DAOM 197198]
MSFNNETQVVSEFNISDEDSSSVKISHDNCYDPDNGEGGFAKVYSATWIDGDAKYIKQDDGNWIKREPKSMEVALKRLNGSQNMSADYLNELKAHWKLNYIQTDSLKFYGMTKDPETEEFIMIMQFSSRGNLRNILSSDFENILWKYNKDCQDSQLIDLEVPSTSKLEGGYSVN